MIHFLTPEYPPRHGGVGDYTHQIATELSRAGETVHVWGPSGSVSEPGSAIVVHPDLGRFRPADLRRTNGLLDTYPSPRRLVVQWVPHGYGQRAMNVPFCLWLWRRSVAGDSIELVVHEPFVTFSGGIRQWVVAAVQRAMTLILMSAARRVWVTTRAWTPLLEPYLAGRGIDDSVAAGAQQSSAGRRGSRGRSENAIRAGEGRVGRSFRHARPVGHVAARSR